jgi:S1-C subfamily serine protease/rhodanese-related sulfurtransferase
VQKPHLAWLDLAVALLGAAGLAAAGTSASRADQLLKAKPATVMVVTETVAEVRLACPGQTPRQVRLAPNRSHGTGFLISADGHVATNGHVVAPYQGEDDPETREDAIRHAIEEGCVDGGLSAARRREVVRQLYPRTAPTARVELRKSLSVILPNRERLSAEVKAYSPALAEGGHQGRTVSPRGAVRDAGKDVAILKVEAANLPALRLGEPDRLRVGDPLAILGYPGVVVDHDFLDKRTALEPTVTAGLVSSLRRDVRGTPVIQTDAAASWGSSGGPALDARGDVAGMLTFISLTADETQAVQGFNFLVPAGVVRDFARTAGVSLDAPSAFNTVWHDAVDRFERRDWQGALVGLDAASRLLPDLPDVQRLRLEAQLRLLDEPSAPRTALLVGVGACGAASLGGVWLLLRRRRRAGPSAEGRRRPAGAPVALPSPVRLAVDDLARALAQRRPLVLLDVRAAGSRAASGVQAKDAVPASPEGVAEACAALPRDQPVVAYDDSPEEEASSEAARRLMQAGYTRVAVLAGGFAAWQAAGLPLERTRPREALPGPASAALPAPSPPSPGLERSGDFAVGVKGSGPYFNARATALRMTGLRLSASHALTPGDAVRLTVFLAGETLEISGRVTAAQPGAQGTHSYEVAFDPLGEEAALTLEGFLLARGSAG